MLTLIIYLILLQFSNKHNDPETTITSITNVSILYDIVVLEKACLMCHVITTRAKPSDTKKIVRSNRDFQISAFVSLYLPGCQQRSLYSNKSNEVLLLLIQRVTDKRLLSSSLVFNDAVLVLVLVGCAYVCSIPVLLYQVQVARYNSSY